MMQVLTRFQRMPASYDDLFVPVEDAVVLQENAFSGDKSFAV